MRRRDFVKAIVVAPVGAKMMFAQQAAVPQTADKAALPLEAETAPAAMERQRLPGLSRQPIVSSVPDLVAITETHFFNSLQLATLRKLSATLMPSLNGYPGALEAGAPEFIDFLIGASPLDRQQMYQSGLDRLNANAEEHFKISFSQVNAAQADTLLRPWLKAWMPDHPPSDPYAHFINIAHQDIRMATMNSQAWSAAATSSGEREPGIGLYWSPIDPDIQIYV